MMRAELWTNWPCAGGTAVGSLVILSGSVTDQLDGTDQCAMEVVQDARVVPLAGMVIRVTDPADAIREYRIVTRQQSVTRPTWQITGTSPLADLATAGLLGGPSYSLSVGPGTAAAIISAAVLTNLAADGVSWLTLGTVENAETFTVSYTGATRLAVLRDLAEKTNTDLVLRRVGTTSYAIDLLARRGSSASTLPLSQAKQVSTLTVTEDHTKTVTAVAVTNTTNPTQTMGQNAWALGTAIGSGPFWIPLTDPAGGAAPIAFDGQNVGLWLLRADGGHTQIAASRASDSAVQVASLTGLTTGQHVAIVTNASGGRVLELTRPANTRIMIRDVSADFRGERNYVRDERVSEWTNSTTPTRWGGSASVQQYARNAPTTFSATATASGADTLITGGPANFTLYQGDTLIIGGTDFYMVTATVTLNGSGAGTIQVIDGGATITGQTGAVSFSTTYRSRPASWPDDGVASSAPVMLFQQRNHVLGGWGPTIPWPPTGGTATWARTTESLSVPADLPYVCAATAWTICAPHGSTVGVGDTELFLPGMMLYRNSTVAATERVGTITTQGVFNQTITCSALHTSAASVQVFAYGGPRAQSYLRWGSIYLANSAGVPAPPIIAGSHANRMWQRGNRLLRAYQDAGRAFTLSLRDLSRAAGYSVTREQLVLGGQVEVQDFGLTARIVGLTWSAVDAGDVQVTLDSRPARLIAFLREVTP